MIKYQKSKCYEDIKRNLIALSESRWWVKNGRQHFRCLVSEQGFGNFK